LLSFLLFWGLDGFKEVKFSFIDLICLTVSGGIGGVIAVNIRKSKA
ncbi:MAG: hypothetical protein GX891_02900, partial [Clostridiales bacterium]|nr:hypothetical protein [Clostridiales bacterium]